MKEVQSTKRGTTPNTDADGFYIVPMWDYVPHYGMRWLLSDKVRDMNHVAVSAYRWLVDHAGIQNPPGVLPADEDKLRAYARCTKSEWERNRAKILANFVLYRDPNGQSCYHHEHLKALFRKWGEKCYAHACKGIAGASARWSKNGGSAPKMPPYADAYRGHAKEVINKITSLPLTPPSAEGAGGAEVGDEQSAPPAEEPLGSYLRKSLRNRPPPAAPAPPPSPPPAPPSPPAPPAPEPAGGA